MMGVEGTILRCFIPPSPRMPPATVPMSTLSPTILCFLC